MTTTKATKAKPKVKCEFDKESMYSKIMPTANKKINTVEIEEDLFEKRIKEMSEAASINVTNVPKMASVSSKSGLNISMPGKEDVLVNLSEYAVNNYLNAAIARFNTCKCDRCMKDIAAIALNKLPVKYVVVGEDQIEEALKKYEVDVKSALVSAIMVVRANPRH